MNKKEKAAFSRLCDLLSGDYSQRISNQLDLWEGRKPARQPLLLKCGAPDEISADFQQYTTREIHFDRDKMLISQMQGALSAALGGMDAVPSVRANMGCGIFPSLFPGIEQLLFDDSRMPWVVGHLDAGAIRKLDYDDIRITDEFKLALSHMEYMAEKLDGTGVLVYPPDLQGPFDIAHIVFGDEIFYAMYDEPELVHHLLGLCVYAAKLGMDESLKVIPRSNELLAHYSSLVMPRSLGGIKLSEDTTTLISAEQMAEFAVPYTAKILEYFGGGYVHYCGRNDPLFERITGLDKARGLNFGNPEKHDMDGTLRKMSARGIIYYGWAPMLDGEDYEAYFRRVRSSATAGGQCRLLLEMNLPYSERGLVKEAWEKAELPC